MDQCARETRIKHVDIRTSSVENSSAHLLPVCTRGIVKKTSPAIESNDTSVGNEKRTRPSTLLRESDSLLADNHRIGG